MAQDMTAQDVLTARNARIVSAVCKLADNSPKAQARLDRTYLAALSNRLSAVVGQPVPTDAIVTAVHGAMATGTVFGRVSVGKDGTETLTVWSAATQDARQQDAEARQALQREANERLQTAIRTAALSNIAL
jgi:hypothetical protein